MYCTTVFVWDVQAALPNGMFITYKLIEVESIIKVLLTTCCYFVLNFRLQKKNIKPSRERSDISPNGKKDKVVFWEWKNVNRGQLPCWLEKRNCQASPATLDNAYFDVSICRWPGVSDGTSPADSLVYGIDILKKSPNHSIIYYVLTVYLYLYSLCIYIYMILLHCAYSLLCFSKNFWLYCQLNMIRSSFFIWSPRGHICTFVVLTVIVTNFCYHSTYINV